MKQIEVLNCGDCPLSANDTMCHNVASETLRQLGYDTSSDPRSNSKIVTELAETKPEVQTVRELECRLRIGRFVSTKSGYAPVVY